MNRGIEAHFEVRHLSGLLPLLSQTRRTMYRRNPFSGPMTVCSLKLE